MSNTGLLMEAEEMGMVAMIGLILVPGVMWVANGKTIGSKVFRGSLVGAAIAVAAFAEMSIDKTVDSASDLLDGKAA